MEHTLELYIDGELIRTSTGKALTLWFHLKNSFIVGCFGVEKYRIDSRGRKLSRATAMKRLQTIKRAENIAAMEKDAR